MHSPARVSDDAALTSLVDAARNALRAELLERGLLFGDTDLLTTAPELLARALALCYPEFDLSSQRVDVVFESVEERGRIEQALLFGWATADVLAPTATDHRRPLLCAMFNLGIGMIDSLCDNDPLRGAALLEFVQS